MSYLPERPNKIKVGAQTYRILYSKESWAKYAPKRDSLCGIFVQTAGVILIKAWTLNEGQQKDTLLHEILHACFGMTSFDSQPVAFLDDKHDVEEFIVLLLTPTLHSVLQDNKDVIDWITSE